MRAAAVSGLACGAAWCLFASAGPSFAVAQAEREADVALVVTGPSRAGARCFELDALQGRIAHYAEGRFEARDLRLELVALTADSAELLVHREQALVARRRFERLPEACPERRDAVALSIALAIEGAVRALAPSAPVPTADESTRAASTVGSSVAESAEPVGEPSESEQPRPAQEPAPAPLARSSDQSAASSTALALDERGVDSQPTAAEEALPDGAQDAREADEPSEDSTPAAAGEGGTWSVELHAGARWLANALPSPVWTGALGFALWIGRELSVDLSAMASTVATSPLAGGSVETRLVGGELLGCYALGLGEVLAQGCAGAAFGACRAQGRDYPVDFPSATRLWTAGNARLSLAWPRQESVSLRLAIQGYLNLVRPELRVDGASEQLQAPWLGFAAGLDLVASLD